MPTSETHTFTCPTTEQPCNLAEWCQAHADKPACTTLASKGFELLMTEGSIGLSDDPMERMNRGQVAIAQTHSLLSTVADIIGLPRKSLSEMLAYLTLRHMREMNSGDPLAGFELEQS